MIGALVQVEGIEPTQHYATDLQSAPALQLWRTCIKRRCKHHKDEMHLLEGMTGIEPASSAWKAEVLATIRHSQLRKARSTAYLTAPRPSKRNSFYSRFVGKVVEHPKEKGACGTRYFASCRRPSIRRGQSHRTCPKER